MTGRRPRPMAWALALLVLAALVLPFVVTIEPPAPEGGWHVNVRWAPAVDSDAARTALERQYGLRLLQQHDERTWVYRLNDASTGNIRALVTDPRVEDTNGIDRQAFRVTAPRVTLARDWADRHGDTLAAARRHATPRALAALLLAVASALALRAPRLRARLAAGIPPLSAEGLGLYRAALAATLVALVVTRTALPTTPFPRELHRSYDWFANWGWVHWLAERPDLMPWLVPLSVALLAAFAAGVFARAAFVLFMVLLTVHVLVVLQHKSAHDWGLPLVTLWGLTLVPWDEGIGLRTRRPAAPRDYGFAVWFPGLMLGLAFAAAAVAKLDSSGLAWITGGAVKYHFLEDFRHAPTQWGLLVASRPALAVALSAGGVLVEALFILHVFWRSAWVRALFALPALALLVGFRLLQGVYWTQWWLLFLAFVPWQAIAVRLFGRERAAVGVGHAALRGAALALVTAVVAVQLAASALRVEMEPFVSDFGMYSWTWASPAAFDAQLARKYRRYSYHAWREGVAGEDLTPRLSDLAKATDLLADVTEGARAGTPLSDDRRRALGALSDAYAQAYGEPLDPLLVTVEEQAFDWERGAFVHRPGDGPVGVLDVERGTLVTVPGEPVRARGGR